MSNKKGVTPLFVYSGDDIDSLNEKMWRDIQLYGKPLTFGTAKLGKFKKKAWEIYAVTQLYGKALDRLYNGELPKGWWFSSACNLEYVDSLKNCDQGDQYYTYGQRAHEASQIERMRHELERSLNTGVQTNRIIGVIWDKYQDLEHEAPPCWQWLQVRAMEDDLVSARTLFRSHCFVNGNWANYGALIKLIRDEIVEPAGGELSELINVSTSAQIGSGDVDTVHRTVGNWFSFLDLFHNTKRWETTQ